MDFQHAVNVMTMSVNVTAIATAQATNSMVLIFQAC